MRILSPITENEDITNKKYVDDSIPSLTDYVKNDDYATSGVGGVVKVTSTYGARISSGFLLGATKTLAEYTSANDSTFISKGTLNNVLEEKQDALVSGINIKTINNESVLGSGNITIPTGASTDVQVNGTSITSSGVANLVTNTAYDSSTNTLATMSDIPSVPVTDVQIDGTSILSSGVASIPVATGNTSGVVKVSSTYGLKVSSGIIIGQTKTLSEYTSASNATVVAKGTLDVVLADAIATAITNTLNTPV